MTRLTMLALLLTAFGSVGCGQSNDSSQPSANPVERHDRYIRLNRQIYARHKDPGSGELNRSDGKFKSASQQLHNMISQEIEIALAAPNPSDGSIVNAISTLQGEMALSAWDQDATNTPFAKLFTLSGIPTLAVAYVIMEGGEGIPDTQAYLEFYDKPHGIWEKKASAPTLPDFKDFTSSVAQLNSGVAGEAWFLAWGIPCGNSQGSEYLRLYAFDGSTVRTIWQRGPLPAGNVTVAPDSVTLDYRDEDTPTGLAHEVLHVTSDGLH
jgi:hypothetical protein